MALPKEPRQKMINLMYLVLTALLALNVSSEILNAFKTVNNSLQNTNNTITNSTSTIMASLQDAINEPQTAEKAKEWYPKAERAQQLSQTAYTYIQGLKDRILRESGFDPSKGDSSFKEDNLDVTTRIMVEKGEGKKLREMLAKYKDEMLAIDPSIKAQFEKTLQIDVSMPPVVNENNNTWQAAYFHMVPSVAALTILSKFQNDVKTSENRIVSFCHEQVGKVKVRFNQFAAIVGQSSNYLMPGQELSIKAGIGAFSTEAKPTITIGGANVPLNDKGFAEWKTTVNSIGTNSIPIHFVYIDQNGQQKTYDDKIEYTVGQTSTSVALDKMNVLFIGIDNPVTIAASGGAEQINATISQGSLSKVGPGKYIARVNSDGECTINVSVSGKSAGSFPFRVRSIPDPVAMVGVARSGDNVSASAFRSQAGVRAVLENFFYDAQFKVTSFRITGDGEGFEDLMEATNSGAAWSGPAQNIVNKVRPGSFITIEDIRAVGPDGRTRKLPPLLYNIK